MSLFRDSLRPPPIASEDALRRYHEIVRAEIEPDPLFRRRLRGLVTNQFVAIREGAAPAAPLCRGAWAASAAHACTRALRWR